MSRQWKTWLRQLWLPGAVASFLFANSQLWHFSRSFPDEDVVVVLPRFAQVLMTGGDRYLAANVAFIRALGNPSSRDSYEHYEAQARIQQDAAWLNPRHEDNYYLAAAMLSWSGHAKAAEEILEKASAARPLDMLPPFFLAFDYFHFEQNPAVGARWMYEAAGRADEQNRYSLSRIAARWAERGDNANDALNMVRLMRQQARGVALKRYMDMRVARLEGLVILQAAAQKYHEVRGVAPNSLEQLLDAGLLAQLPVDPFQMGYFLDERGVPQLVQPPSRMAPPPQAPKPN